ncbi:neuroglobin-1 [Nilaparvata lugens]|uniref:neuroglobin-1 n=1 Tax=Nilaparvata lugens TaxID=108931 RepID=UPI00193DBF4E|nr:neuroglobin-1 [Nilaparvata lugens]
MNHVENNLTGTLTTEHKEIVKQTWAIVEADKSKHGKDLFFELFVAFPDYLSFFKGKLSSKEDLLTDEKFAEEHVVGKVMNSIGKVVENLDNESVIEAALLQIGRNHYKRQVLEPHFENAKKVLLAVLERNLGDLWTKEVGEAWVTTLNVAFSILYRGLQAET